MTVRFNHGALLLRGHWPNLRRRPRLSPSTGLPLALSRFEENSTANGRNVQFAQSCCTIACKGRAPRPSLVADLQSPCGIPASATGVGQRVVPPTRRSSGSPAPPHGGIAIPYL